MEQVEKAGVEILRVLCGSRAYGLADDDSDFDYHGVFVVPTSRLLEINEKEPPIKAWIEGETMDDVSWEVRHFLEMAVHCNPTVLETFVAPVEGELSLWGSRVRALFPYVISRKRVFEAFQGYAKNQRKKMFEPTGGVQAWARMWKFGVAYLRSLHHGNTQRYDPYIQDEDFRGFLYRVKLGSETKGKIIDRAEVLHQELCDAYVRSPIAEEPSMDVVNELLLDIRKAFWQ